MQLAPAGSVTWRRHPYVWGTLLLGAALGWIVTIQQAGNMTGMSRAASGMADVSPSPSSAAVFLPVWVAMMAAMMFPAIAPVVSLVNTVNRKQREAGKPSAPTAVFVTGYLVVWTLFGAGAYLVSRAAPGIKSSSSLIAGLILVGAGIYEWSLLKGSCLRHCRSPLSVFLRYWRDGWKGAVRMGVIHGAICLGCCWELMLVRFAVGLMNLTAMVALAAVIFGQKVLPYGEYLGRIAGAALIVTGLAFALAL